MVGDGGVFSPWEMWKTHVKKRCRERKVAMLGINNYRLCRRYRDIYRIVDIE